MICIGGDLHRRPPMHALYALSQDAPAGRGCTEEMCYRSRTRPQDGGRRVPTRGKKRLTTQGEKEGEDALRRPQSKAGGDAAGGAEPWAPGGPPGGTRGHGPREVRVPPAVAHTREAMDHGHRHEATISNPGLLPLPQLGTIVL